MSQPPNLSPQDTQEVSRFQNIQQQLEFMMQQKSSLQHQLDESTHAIKELESAGDATVYKSAGGIFIKSSVSVLLNSTKERKEELEIRLNSITKQVERINKQYEEQKVKIQEINKKLGY